MLGIMSEHSLGLEITDQRLLLAEVSKKRGEYHLREIVQAAIPLEVMAEGKVKQVDTLAELIRHTLLSANIRSKKVNLVVPSQFVVIRQLQLPDLSKTQLRKVIDFELQNTIHLPFEDPVYDFVKVDPSEAATPPVQAAEGGKLSEANVTLIATSRSAIDALVESATRAGLKPASVDIRALALSRTYRQLSGETGLQTTMFVDVAEESTDIHIFHGDELKFTRNIPMSLDNYRFDKERGKPLSVLELLAYFQENTDFRSFTLDLAYEVERSVNFFRYTLNNREAALSNIVLTGVLPKSGVLAEYLQERIVGIPIYAMPFQKLHPQKQGQENLYEYAIPIGLALKEV